MKKYLSFDELSDVAKQIFSQDTWCDKCEKSDLGINNSKIIEKNKSQFISGNCKFCGAICISQIIEITD